MALIKCVKCGNKISDKADSCPKCGYKVEEKKTSNKLIYIVVGIIVLLIGAKLFLDNKANSLKNYNSAYFGISFDYKSSYDVKTNDDGFIYIANSYENNEANFPYVMVGRFDEYKYPVLFFNYLNNYMRSEYGNSISSSIISSGIIGDKTVYEVTYKYSDDGKTIIDNRYVITINNIIYMIGSKEVNENTDEINSIVEIIIKSMKGLV